MADCAHMMRAMMVVVMAAIVAAAPSPASVVVVADVVVFRCCRTEAEGGCPIIAWTSPNVISPNGGLAYAFMMGPWTSPNVSCQSEELCYFTCKSSLGLECVSFSLKQGGCSTWAHSGEATWVKEGVSWPTAAMKAIGNLLPSSPAAAMKAAQALIASTTPANANSQASRA